MGSSEPRDDAEGAPHRITFSLDRVLEERSVTLTELAHRTGITMANLSVLKNNRAKAIRFTTLTAICDALDCTPQDLIGIDDASG